MCKYCEEEKGIKPDVSNGSNLSMGAMIDMLFGVPEDDDRYTIARIDAEAGILLVDNSYGEYSELGFRINYCPICGRSIAGKETEND